MKYHIVSLVFLSLLIYSPPQIIAAPCSYERGGARIIAIQGPKDQVKLIRDGKEILVEVGECLVWNDRLDAGLASVSIKAKGTTVKIGRDHDSNTYYVGPPPEPNRPRSREISEKIQLLFDYAAQSAKWSSPGIGRDAFDFCEKRTSNSKRRLTPLRHIPVGYQRVGSDLAILLIGWSPTLGREEISVRLSGADSKDIIAEHRVCGVAHIELPIPSDHMKSEGKFVLTVTTQSGEVLTWSIEIVSPTSLIQPPETIEPAWMLGAWRMETGGSDLQLDAVSRLASGVESYLAAQEILSAVLANVE